MSILIGNTYYTNISPVMTSNTAPSPYVAECSINCVNVIWKALDGDVDSYLRTNILTVTPFTLSLDYGEGNEKVVSAYRLDCHQNVSWTMKSWNFEGSNNNNTWDILDSRSDISWIGNTIQNFTFDNSTKYRYYRFNVLEKNGTNSVCINEIELLQEDPSTNLEFRKVRKNNLPSSKTDGIDTVYFTEDGEIYVTDKNGNLKQSGVTKISTAETTTYTNVDYPAYTNVDLALDALFNKVYYVKPTCSLSASKTGGTFEIGTTITAPITFTWTTNKAITSQTLTGCTLADASVRTAIYNTNVTSDKVFTLSVSDGENSASSSVSYKFLNKVYYGSASEPNSYDSAFILGLANNKFATSIKGSYPITVESGQFGYIACPKSFNAPSECYIGGFLTTLENAGEISFTNASGGVAIYTILRTGKSGLGSLTMEFK